MEYGFRHALDSVASAFLPESEFARDDAEKPIEASSSDSPQKPAKEPWQMSRKQFESNYMQHSILRPESKPEEVEHGIRQDGFSQGIGPNVVRPTAGNPTDIMQRNYGTKSGVPVIAVPSLHTQQGGNGTRIKQGWKFEGGHIGVPERDYEPLHRIVVRTALAAGKPVPPEVLAEHPDLVSNKPVTESEFARKPAAGQKGFDFDEESHPRESELHDGKRPGEFAPRKSEPRGDSDFDPLTLTPENVAPHLEANATDIISRNPKMSPQQAKSLAAARIFNATSKAAGDFRDRIDTAVKNGEPVSDEDDDKYSTATDVRKSLYGPLSEMSGYRPMGDIDHHKEANMPLVSLPVAATAEPEVWHQGDRVRMTGKTSTIAGGTFHEAEILEGHKKGQMVQIRDKGEKDAEAASKQQEWKDQQAGFANLHNSKPEKAVNPIDQFGTGAGAVFKPKNAGSGMISADFKYKITNDVPTPEGGSVVASKIIERKIGKHHGLWRLSVIKNKDGSTYSEIENGKDRRGSLGGAETSFHILPDEHMDSQAVEPIMKLARKMWESQQGPKESQMFSRPGGACRSMLIAAIHKALDHDGKYTKDASVEEIPENPTDLDEHTAAVLSAISEHSPEVKTALAEYLAS